ncbi:MAG: QcrA and Rieske domain-containing protein [Candidatus Dormibacteria bacterium]
MRKFTRRQFMVMGTGMGMGLIGVLLSIPAIGFLLSPLFEKRRLAWVTIGPIDSIPLNTPTIRYAAMPSEQGFPTPPTTRVVYVVRKSDGDVLALSNICTHMQCDVHWDAQLQQFLCPCHGGLYNMDGVNVGGPPPQPLAQWVHRFAVDPITGAQTLEVQNQLNESI